MADRLQPSPTLALTSHVACRFYAHCSGALLQQQCCQAEIRYRGSFLCRAVPLPVLAHTLHRVLRGWLSHQLRKYSFQDIQAMVHKLIAAFKPTEQVRVRRAKESPRLTETTATHLGCAT